MADKNSSMADLVEALTSNDEAKCAIYNVYRVAAEKDLEFKKLKEEERKLRYYISIKVNLLE